MQILTGVQGIGSAFKAAKKLPWRHNHTNTKHVCPECMAKITIKKTEPAEGCAVQAGDIAKDGGK